jgi:hypothetical protein
MHRTNREEQKLQDEPVAGEGCDAGPRAAPETAPSAVRHGALLRAALPTLLLAGGIGVLDVLRRNFQHGQLFLPERYPNGAWQPETYGVQVEDSWFHSADGTLLHGWWIPARRARGTVLYCHGNSGNITSRLVIFRHLRQLRLNVFAFDYRGYGRSQGRPSELGVLRDAHAAYDYLVAERAQGPERIVLLGHSLGGAVAIDCALHRPVAGLIAQSTFTDVREMARVRFPGLPLHLVASNQFRSLDKVPRIAAPKLFVHGSQDETIPLVLGRRLYEIASDPKDWYEVPHAGHNDVNRLGGWRYLWKIQSFTRRCFEGARAILAP